MKQWWAIVVMVVACGKDSPGTVDARNGSGSAGGGGCMLTLSGGQTGTYACTARAAWNSSNNTGAVSLLVQGFTGMITISYGFPGEPHTGTFRSTDTGAKGGASIVTGSGASTMVWVAATGSGTPIGSYDVTLSSVTTVASDASGKAYAITGSSNATLQAQTGGGAAVTLQATF